MAKEKKEKVEVVSPASKASIREYDLIKEPVVTEKSSVLSESFHQYTFLVDKKAAKTEIRKAIEHIYNVHVVEISTCNVKSKELSRGSKYKGKLPSYKKAIVRLREGEAINLFAE